MVFLELATLCFSSKSGKTMPIKSGHSMLENNAIFITHTRSSKMALLLEFNPPSTRKEDNKMPSPCVAPPKWNEGG
jgi:hypothetical protein